MYLKSLELTGFKSFLKKSLFELGSPITAIVGPNGSGKSNVAEAFRFVLGEQSIKSLRGKRGEDLIFSGSQSASRSNRASAKLTFDNRRRILNIDYDEVSIERVVHRDSSNQYFINNSQVRLRDVIELLSSSGAGSTGHHIISQGEADRILSVNAKERKVMIEDSLGLKIYQYKKKESQRKLEKTEENIKSVEGLRKEIAPHIKFLKKQAKKLEESLSIREDLQSLFSQYLKGENIYLYDEKIKLEKELSGPTEKMVSLEGELKMTKEALSKESNGGESTLSPLEKEGNDLSAKKDKLLIDMGRIEGEMAGEKRISEKLSLEDKSSEDLVSLSQIEKLSSEIDTVFSIEEHESSGISIKDIALKIKELIKTFINKHKNIKEEENKEIEDSISRHKNLEKEKEEISSALLNVSKKEEELQTKLKNVREKMEREVNDAHQAERKMFSIMSERSELRALISEVKMREKKLESEEADYKREVTSATMLFGQEFSKYASIKEFKGEQEKLISREGQEERRRNIERMKIRLEDAGGGSGDEVMKEYKDIVERDEFLEKEIEDLENGAKSLFKLIKELDEKLDVEFKEGLKKINNQFQEFFSLMFGGGSASLFVVKQELRKKVDSVLNIDIEGESDLLPPAGGEEEEGGEEGIEVNVSLPRKKIKGLVMLSGGERALTSIALLFAISQVNPPPFIVLDETDAALDEANSKRYGDMVENLSKSSQLILITHNRETMSRAGMLYGVTMDSNGISKLLSVGFNEAVQVAK